MAESIVVAFPLSVTTSSPHIPCEDSHDSHIIVPSVAGRMSLRPSKHHAPGVWTFYVSSESLASTDYVVQHIRRRGMNRWQCSCPQFFFRCLAHRRHCKHIRLARASR
jgi:hypothetical protein